MNKLEEGSYRKCGVNPSPTEEDLRNRPSKPGASLVPAILDFHEECFSLQKKLASLTNKLIYFNETLNTIKEKLEKVETKKDCVGFVRDLRKYLKGE